MYSQIISSKYYEEMQVVGCTHFGQKNWMMKLYRLGRVEILLFEIQSIMSLTIGKVSFLETFGGCILTS